MRPAIFVVAFWWGLYASFEPIRSDPREGAFLAPAKKPRVDPQDASAYGPLTVFHCGIPHVCVHARRRTP